MLLRTIGRAMLALSVCLTAACGGGGGGGAGAVSPGSQSPSIAVQPQSASVVAPSAATFSATANGTPPPTYQWRQSLDAGVTYSDLPGAVGATYTTPPTQVSDNGRRFLVRVNNSVGTVDSQAATLTVIAPLANHFGYGLSVSGNRVLAYSFSGSTGGPTQLTGSPYSPVVGPGLTGLTVHPSKNFIYVTYSTGSNGGIFGYAIDSGTGQLSPVPGTPSSSGSSVGQVAVHPNGRFVYAARNSSAGIDAYSVDSSSGALTALAGSPFAPAQGSRVTIDPTGQFAFVLSVDAVNFSASAYAFAINAASGALTAVPGSPFALPPNQLYGGMYIHPNGQFIYFPSYANTVAAFAIQASNGALSPISGSPFVVSSLGASGLPVGMAFDSTGKFAYFDVRSYPISSASNPKTIYGFTVNPTTGSLAALTGNPFGANFGSSDPACGLTNAISSPLLLQGGNGAASLTVDAGTGALSVLSSVTHAGGGCPLALDPTGTFAYGFGNSSATGYRLDGSSGGLVPIVGSPFPIAARTFVFR